MDMFIPKKRKQTFPTLIDSQTSRSRNHPLFRHGSLHNFSTAPDCAKRASTTSSWTQQKCRSNSLCENVPTNIIARAWSNGVSIFSIPCDAEFVRIFSPPLKLDITKLHVYISNVTCCPTRLLYHLKERGSSLCFSQFGEVRFPSATPIQISRLAGISHMVPRQFGGRLSRPMMS